MSGSKEPIRLRKRTTRTGLQSLYLDIYLYGKRSYEYLRLYLIPEKSRADKEKNRQTMLLAEAIKAKRIVELRNGQYGFSGNKASSVNFFDFYKAMMRKRETKESISNYNIWMNCLGHLQTYEKRQDITFADITPKWVEGFKKYLETKATSRSNNNLSKQPLSQNTQAAYYIRLKTCVNKAIDEGIITTNPMRNVESIKWEETERIYLTMQELRVLVQTPCRRDEVKRMFLFSCLTGLRKSDIIKLQWKDIYTQGGYTRIIFKQKKTKGQEYLDIAPQAVELLGERDSPDCLVFGENSKNWYLNQILQRWINDAGINKTITFHCARHTFAVMMLDIGTDIYTVSKLLGHRDLSTTQIYAKVLDKNKQAAVANIPKLL